MSKTSQRTHTDYNMGFMDGLRGGYMPYSPYSNQYEMGLRHGKQMNKKTGK